MKAFNHQIVIGYPRGIALADFDEFTNDISSDKLDLHYVQREGFVPQLSVDLLIPPALVGIWIAKSYFEGFLKEMGREHYQLLKKGLLKLWGKFLGPAATPVKRITADGESRQVPKYSLSYSIIAQGHSNIELRLLFQEGISQEDYKHALDSFLAFLTSFHNRTLDATMKEKLASALVVNTVLLEFDLQSRQLEPINPVPERFRIAQRSADWLDGQP